MRSKAKEGLAKTLTSQSELSLTQVENEHALVAAADGLWVLGRHRNARAEELTYFTSSGSVPVGLPAASRVIFSTRASACRNNSSQRRLSSSPRS